MTTNVKMTAVAPAYVTAEEEQQGETEGIAHRRQSFRQKVDQTMYENHKQVIQVCAWLTAALVITLIVGIIIGINKVQPNEVAVSYNPVLAVLHETPLTEGLHWLFPFSYLIRWPTRQVPVDAPTMACNSKDGLKILLDFSFQYLPDVAKVYNLTMEYKDFDNHYWAVVSEGTSTAKHTCGNFSAEEFQTKRSEVSTAIMDEIAYHLREDYHAILQAFQLRDLQRPDLYETAVRNKEDARSEITLAQNERVQKLTQAETTLSVAKQEMAKKLYEANIDADVTELEALNLAESVRLFYDTTKQVYKSLKDAKNLTENAVLALLTNAVTLGGDVKAIALSQPFSLDYSEDI